MSDNPNADADARAVEQVLKFLGSAGIAVMSREDKCSLLSAMMLASYQLLRSVEGDEFVRGFFESSLSDLANPAPVGFAPFH